jgi:lipopolysaccharide/colanic/teichoic acid biosynthesis glycosyltransferase
VRRLLDVAVAAGFGVLLSPVAAAATVASLVERSGPVLRRSPRLGRDAVPFELLTFRTMRAGRLTPVGRILRRYSVDHVPMLVNVLRGDLALVGPRPTEPDRVDHADPRWRAVLSVRPGLVSHAIVHLRDRYTATPPEERLALELEYVGQAGFGSDLRLLRRAAVAFLASRGNVKAPRNPAGPSGVEEV